MASNELLGELLGELSGEHGDVHMQDLATIMSKDVRQAAADAAAHGGGAGTKELKNKTKLSGLQGAATKSIEKYKMVRDALRFTARQNDSLPDFGEDQLLLFVQSMRTSQYRAGQNICTQGETGDSYYVLRRGRAHVIIDGEKIAEAEFGMGFGETALVLDIARTATVQAATPCEAFVLDRGSYDTGLRKLPPRLRISKLQVCRRRDCHSAARPSTLSMCFNGDGEGVPAK